MSRSQREGEAPAILDKPVIDAIKQRRIEIIAAVESFDATGVVLSDPTRLEPDVVIAATGYTTGLEPLVGHLGVLDEHGRPLVFAADQHPRAPGLHFVGYQVTLGGTFRLVGIEARQVARALAGRS